MEVVGLVGESVGGGRGRVRKGVEGEVVLAGEVDAHRFVLPVRQRFFEEVFLLAADLADVVVEGWFGA